MVGETDVLQLLKADAERVETRLRRVLDDRHDVPPKLREAIAYSLMAGGKRLRPALVLESARCCSGDETVSDTPLAAAGEIERNHTTSLRHDDSPATDA